MQAKEIKKYHKSEEKTNLDSKGIFDSSAAALTFCYYQNKGISSLIPV